MFRTSRTTRLGTIIIVAAVGGGLVACQAAPSASPGPTTTATSSSPTPSPSPTTQSPEEEAIDKAEYAVRDYYRVLGLALQNPEDFNREDFKDVAISSALLAAQNVHSIYLAEGRRDIGSGSVEVVDVRSVDLTNKPNANPPVTPSVELMVCVDSTNINTVDKDGKSILPPDRQLRNLVRVGTGTAPDDIEKWLVWYLEFQKGETC